MKKASSTAKDELRPEYTRSDFGELVRGKYAGKIAAASNVVLLELEVSKVFPNDQAVNDALRSLIDIAKATARPTHASRGPPASGAKTPRRLRPAPEIGGRRR